MSFTQLFIINEVYHGELVYKQYRVVKYASTALQLPVVNCLGALPVGSWRVDAVAANCKLTLELNGQWIAIQRRFG